jgi:hypothetical protein
MVFGGPGAFWLMLGPDFKETTWRYEVNAERKVATTSSSVGKVFWEVPLSPFLGCLDVAPAIGVLNVRYLFVKGDTFMGG